MQQGSNVQIETQQAVPIMTMMLVFAGVVVFYLMEQNRMEFFGPNVGAINWMERNSIQAITIAQWLRDSNWGRLAAQFPMAALASFTGWQLLLNSYFIWVFGSTVEQKLGPLQYLGLVFAAMYMPYILIAYNHFKAVDSTYFYGALYLILALIGAGMVFPEEKKVRMWFKKSRGEIFQRGNSPDAASKFKVNTALFTMVYIAYAAGLWFFSDKVTPGFKTFDIFAAIFAFVFGYGLAYFLVWSATGDLKEGPVKLMCIRKYNDCVKLDVGHELAVRSTSMALGLPEERVRQWVSEKKGKMKVS